MNQDALRGSGMNVSPLAGALLCAATAMPACAQAPVFVCRHCGRALLVVQVFLRADNIRGPPAS